METRKMKRTVLSSLILFVAMVSSAMSEDRHVPSLEYPTIEDAVNASAPSGDRIIIAPGIYKGYWEKFYAEYCGGNWVMIWHAAIDPQGKNIIFTSVDPNDEYYVENTIIYGGVIDEGQAYYEPCAYFHKGENANCQLIGLTIKCGFFSTEGIHVCTFTRGYPVQNYCVEPEHTISIDAIPCGAIVCDGASPTILKCKFEGGYVSFGSGECTGSGDITGIYLENSDAVIQNCPIFINNLENDYSINNNYPPDGSAFPVIRIIGTDETEHTATIINSNFFYNSVKWQEEYLDIINLITKGHLQIEHCTILGNNKGRCVYTRGTAGISPIGNVTISNSTIDGGGLSQGLNLSNTGEINITGSTIKYCHASNDGCTSGSGAGIRIETELANVIIDDCTLTDNTSYCEGGAIFISRFITAVINNCTIGPNNKAGCQGGGIYIKSENDGRNITISNCMITGNEADRDHEGEGGGIWTSNTNSNIRNSTIMGNIAYKYGGAVLSGNENGEGEIDNSIFWGNLGFISDPDVDKQQIHNESFRNTNIKDCYIEHSKSGTYEENIYVVDVEFNESAPNEDYIFGRDRGGNIPHYEDRVYNINQNQWYHYIQAAINAASEGDELVAFPSTYYENINTWGKAITVRSIGSSYATIIDGSGNPGAPAFYFNGGQGPNMELKGFTVKNGSTGVYCYCSYPTISNCIIEGYSNYGIYYSSPPSNYRLNVKNSIIRNNTYGIMAGSAAGTFEENQIYGNNYGIYAAGGSTTTIEENQIYSNWRGIYTAGGSNATIERNKIYDNSWNGSSYGIYAETSSITTIRNNFIYHNRNGILALSRTGVNISNNTIVYNTDHGITGSRTKPTIYNCILWGNDDDLQNCNAKFSCIQHCEDAGGEENICGEENNPRFAANNDYHLKSDSPCINKGDPDSDKYKDQTDIDGEPRVQMGRVDMGADETPYYVTAEPPIYPDAHWWKLDEGSGTTAGDSVGDSNGTFNGGAPNWVDGLIGGAVDFDGADDYFSVASLDDSYNQNSIFTVAGWFKTDQSAGKQTIVGQWSQDDEAGYEYYGWQVLVENEKVIARFGNELYTYDITGTKDVNVGDWYHFAMVRNGTNNVVLYVNGQPDGTGAASFSSYRTKFRIGDGSARIGNPPMKGGPFNGLIDDVMIFNSVLSAEEVEQLYQYR
jgi:parallel beta-helix repeat protein